jgi:hypothetical protein
MAPSSKNGYIFMEVFTLPHIIHVDSSGFQWPSCQARLAGAMPSPLDSSPVQSSASLLITD